MGAVWSDRHSVRVVSGRCCPDINQSLVNRGTNSIDKPRSEGAPKALVDSRLHGIPAGSPRKLLERRRRPVFMASGLFGRTDVEDTCATPLISRGCLRVLVSG